MSAYLRITDCVESFEYMPRSGMSGSLAKVIFSFLRHLCADFHSGCTVLHHNSNEKVFLLPISSPAHAITCFLNLGYSDLSTTKPQSTFSLHFPDGHKDAEHLSVFYHLCFFFGEVSISFCILFLDCIICFLDVQYF